MVNTLNSDSKLYVLGIEDPDQGNPTMVTYSVPNLEPSTTYYFHIKSSNTNDEGNTESDWAETNGTTKGKYLSSVDRLWLKKTECVF